MKPDSVTTKTHVTWTSDVATGDLIFSGRVVQHDLIQKAFNDIRIMALNEAYQLVPDSQILALMDMP